MLISSENNVKNINLNFLLRFECAGAGNIKRLLKVAEFRKRMTEAVILYGYIDERVFVNVLKRLHNDAKGGMFQQGDLPLGLMRNVINRLERSIQVSDCHGNFESKEVLP